MYDYYRRTSNHTCSRCYRNFMLSDVCRAIGRIFCDDCYDKTYPKEPTMEIESKVEEQTLDELLDDLSTQMHEQTQLILQLVELLDPEGLIEIPEGLHAKIN